MSHLELRPVPEDDVAAALVGAIDLHRHGYPELSSRLRPRLDDVDDLERCRDAGFAGVVMKSHLWPTIGRCYHLEQRVPGIDVHASITLNRAVGGLSPFAVEAAADQGARMVFLPTWSARHDQERGGMSALIARTFPGADLGDPIDVVDGDGRLTGPARDTLEAIARADLPVSTGHLSPRESIAVVEAGIVAPHRIVFSHPDSGSVGAERAHVDTVADAGGFVEVCALGLMPPFQRISLDAVVELIERVGPARCVLTTDHFFSFSPPSAETMRMLVSLLLARGLTVADVHTMLRDNPAAILARTADAQATPMLPTDPEIRL